MNSKPLGQNPLGKKLGRKSKTGGIAALVLVGIYSLAAPQLNAKLGWNLPAITSDALGNVRLVETDPIGHPVTDSTPATHSAAPDDSAATTIAPAAKTDASDNETSELLHGILREVSPRRFMSPQGLLYTPGSAEGHRLDHLARHTKDMPSRPGSHGVFDGDMAGALQTIDRAYERAKKNQRTTKSVDDGRTIYTVDMGGRIGFVGGRDGQRKRNPMARRVRLVLDGNRVITAYPM
jgi:hypothetical protein